MAVVDRSCKASLCSENGTITVYVCLFSLVLLGCLGLVVDGGARLEAMSQAREVADNAARLASQKLDPFGEEYAVTVGQAESLARSYVDGYGGKLESIQLDESNEGDVTVVVAMKVDYKFLPGSSTVTGVGSASGKVKSD